MNIKTKGGFTLIEILVVIGIVAVLAVVAVLAINPAQLLMQSRDSNRISSLSTISNAVAFAKANGVSLGTPNIAYVSIPDPTLTGNATSTCASLGLPAIASTTYQCVSPANLTNNNGTGWIPITFNTLPGSPLGTIPVDPTNTTSSNEYFVYTTNGTGYEVMADPEAAKDASNTANFENGSTLALLTSFPGTGSSGSGCSANGKNVWVLDYYNEVVDDFSSCGTLLSSFGTYGTSTGDLYQPAGMAIDSSGDIWVANQNGASNDYIQKFSPSGTYLSGFDAYGIGGIEGAEDIAIATSGNIWAVNGYYTVMEFSPSGSVLNQFGSWGTSAGQFEDDDAIAIDPTTGNIWVADGNNERVEEFSSSGSFIMQFPIADYGYYGIAVDASGNIWVSGSVNTLLKYSPSGTLLYNSENVYGYGTSPGQLDGNQGIAIDSNGNVWVANSNGFKSDARVEEFSATDTYISEFGSYGTGNGQLTRPKRVIVK